MRGYRFRDATLALECDAPAIAQWLDEFVRPAFERWSGPADVRVAVRTDPASYAALAATRPPGPLAEAACFALDSRVVSHPSWVAGGRTVLADAKYGALYALDEATAAVLAGPEAVLFRGGVMRVVRELLTARALVSPRRVQLHAAACEVRGRVVLIAGAKEAGKTTLLAYLAASAGGHIVANDRVVVERAHDGFVVRGVPTLVSVRPETRALVPRLWHGMTLERPAHLTAAELDAATRAGGPIVTTRLRLSPWQLARQLDVSLGEGGSVAAVVFPAPGDGLTVERLAGDVALGALRGARFGRSSGKAGATVFERALPERRPPDADAAMLEAIAARVPCFAARLGRDRFADPRAAHDLLDAVLAAGAAA